MARTRKQSLNLEKVFSRDSLDKATKVAQFVGLALQKTKHVNTASLIVESALVARKIFLDTQASADVIDLHKQKQLRALSLLKERLSFIDKDKEPEKYAYTLSQVNKLLEELTDDVN